MSLRINREIFDRVKAAILQTRRIEIYWCATVEGGREVKPVSEIRALRLMEDCRTAACIGGWQAAVRQSFRCRMGWIVSKRWVPGR
jgi:hypothetical protein